MRTGSIPFIRNKVKFSKDITSFDYYHYVTAAREAMTAADTES